MGIYREKDELLPVIARSPEKERMNLNDLGAVRVWSAAGFLVPIIVARRTTSRRVIKLSLTRATIWAPVAGDGGASGSDRHMPPITPKNINSVIRHLILAHYIFIISLVKLTRHINSAL